MKALGAGMGTLMEVLHSSQRLCGGAAGVGWRGVRWDGARYTDLEERNT
jgi:hypothetical protein